MTDAEQAAYDRGFAAGRIAEQERLRSPEVIEAMALGRCGSGWNGPLCPAPCEDCIEDVRSAIRAVTGGALPDPAEPAKEKL